MRIGIFGGTFNPIHYGHLRAAEEARESLSLDKVLFIPSGNPPLKSREIAAADHRYAMARCAVAKNRFFKVLDLELERPGKSYTVNTLEVLRDKYRGAALYFLLGIDAFLDIPNWWKPSELLSMVNFAVLSRPESSFVNLTASPYLSIKKGLLNKLDRREMQILSSSLSTGRELVLLPITPIGISSTRIREYVRKGVSTKYLLPEKVESYIISHRLYHA